MTMTSELQAFLAAEDLDEVLNARQKIAALDAGDTAVVRSVLQQWRNPQAISNLLMHASLIPKDVRLPSLFRGLAEREVVYYVLAAVVGVQGIDPAGLATKDRERVLTELLAVIRDTTGILAQRASVSFQAFAIESDAPKVFALMAHTDDTVRHNLRAWLFRTFQSHGSGPFAAAARQSGVAESVQRRVVGEFTEFVTNPPQGFKSPVFSLFGYIPNLLDVLRSAEHPASADRPRD
jgi:hypothetical protein